METPETQYIVKESTVKQTVQAIKNGLEYAEEALIHHDAALGRTTIKNKRQAEMMEADIAQMKSLLQEYKDRYLLQ